MSEQRVIILRGLPGSGKSTWAKAWRDEDPKNRAVVNRDSIRFELFGKYEDLAGWQEARVSAMQEKLADLSIREGMSLCVDDVHAQGKRMYPWKKFARERNVPVEVKVFDTSLEECLRRNNKRGEEGGRFVPEDVILRMDAPFRRSIAS